MIRVINNIHFGWDTTTGYPINQYIFAISDASELPSSPWTDPRDGSMHIIKGGSRSWDIGNAAMYGYKDSTWTRQFTMNGGGEPLHGTTTGVPPISFKANGKPLISWSMLGNGQQTGTPTHDNPVMPTFCGVRTAQLLDIKDGTQTINNVVWTAYHGTITGQGTTTAVSESDAVIVYDGKFTRSGNYINYCKIQSSKSIKPPAGTYTFSANATISSSDSIALIVGDIDTYFSNGSARKIAVGETFSVNGNEYVMLVVSSYINRDQYVFAGIMLNSGSTPLPYEPYGWAEKITCAGQTTPVYLGQVSTVRKIRKLVLTGDENFALASTDTNRTVCYILLSGCKENYGFCTHITWKSLYQSTEYDRIVWTAVGGGTLYISLSNAYLESQTVGAFKDFLAAQYANGTPVTVWYVLAEPQTAIVNEQLAKIGDYADELHSADAGVTIPTAKGQNTLTVEGDLQPSSMTIEF